MSSSFVRPTPLFPTWENPFAFNNPMPKEAAIWERISYVKPNAKGNEDPGKCGIIDFSTFEETKNDEGIGECLVYNEKKCEDHYSIDVVVTLLTPLHAGGVVVYNLLRIVPVVIYLAGRIFYDWHKDKDNEQRPLKEFAAMHVKEMGYQTWLSIANIIRTPYYAGGMMAGLLYGIVNPWSGRRMAMAFERAWNHNMTVDQGFWSINGAQKRYFFEGMWRPGATEKENGKAPGRLGHHAFYIPGCYQPIAIAKVKKEQVNGKDVYTILSLNSPVSGAEFTNVAIIKDTSSYIIPQGCQT